MSDKLQMSVETILKYIRFGIINKTNPLPLLDDLLNAIQTEDRFKDLREPPDTSKAKT